MPLLSRRASLLALSFFFACGCGGSDAKDSGRQQIAVIPKGTQHVFWNAIHAGALQAGKELGVEILWKGPTPEGDRQAQIHLLQNFVTSGVHGIVLAPIDEQALARPVADAAQNGVPVVVIDSNLQGDAHAAFVATDNRKGGELAGEKLAAELGGKGKVIVLRFQQGSASTTQREEGALAALAKHSGIEVVSKDQYAGDEQKAKAAAAALLLAHPDATGVFCPNESTTHGFLVALQQSGKAGTMKFTGFDASEALVKGLEQGHIHGLVLQDPVAMAAQGVRACVAALRKQPVEKSQTTELALATPQNCKEPRIASLLQPDLSILKGQ
jgi:ribose transport system substrate-binding protein